MYRQGKNAKLILFIYMTVELLICSAPQFGWPALVYILRKEKYYDYVCERSNQICDPTDVNMNSTGMTILSETVATPTLPPSSTWKSGTWTKTSRRISTTNENASTNKALTTEKASIKETIATGILGINKTKMCHSYIMNCPDRETRLNGIFVVSVVSTSVSLLAASIFVDKFGPRVCRLVSAILFASSGVLWIFASNDFPFLVYLALPLLAIAGSMSSLPLLQISAVIYDKYQATVISIENGAIDVSAVVLFLFKQIYDSRIQVSFLWVLSIYCGFVASMILVTTIALLPTRKEYQLLEYIKSCKHLSKSTSKIEARDYENSDTIEIVRNDLILSNVEENEAIGGSKFIMSEIKPVTSKTLYMHMPGKNIVDKAKDSTEEGYMVKQYTTTVDNSTHLIQDKDYTLGNTEITETGHSEQSDLRISLFSTVYFWELLLLSISMTRMYFYVSAFDNLVLNISKDPNILSKYTNIFGIIQFTGIVFAPMLGPYIDGKLSPSSNILQKSKEETESTQLLQKLQRYSISFAITNSLGVIMEALVLIPNLRIQVISMVFQVAMRGFLYAVHFSYIATAFPAKHYGKLASIAMLIGCIVSCVQYPLISIMEGPLNGDPFYIHLALLFISFVVYGQSIHLSLKVVKAKLKRQSKFESIQDSKNLCKV